MTKEEKKDEMKNRISLALKDPILQQGFEIICKENAELNEKLSEQKLKINYAKTIIQDLLDNSDESARQRAIDFLKEIECQSSTNS